MPRDADTITKREFWLRIECDNAAFDDDDLCTEIARILRARADCLDDSQIIPGYHRRVFDINGNACGTVEFTASDYRR